MTYQQYPPQPPAWNPPPRARRSKGKTAGLGCLAVIGAILIAAIISVIADGGDSRDSAQATAKSSAPALTDEQRASIRAEAGLPPEPDTATRTAYIADLNAIDPDIVHGKDDTAVSRGLNQCSTIKETKDRKRLIETTNYRFTSPDHPDGHGTATAEKILDIVHKRLCPDF